jgi:outer membrane protein assembly factor BamD (BamD/ComL family)
MRAIPALLATVALSAVGCGNLDLLRARYRAEQIHWSAARAELAARLASEEPDSVQLLALRDSYRAVALGVRLQAPAARDETSLRLRRHLVHIIGTAELQGGKLGLEANRVDLALEDCDRVAELAVEDTALSRDVDFFRVQALRASGRDEDAIAAMRDIVRRHQPALSTRNGTEDPVLSLPEAIVVMRKEMGDRPGVVGAIQEAEAYYGLQLTRGFPPEGEAGIRARLVRLHLEESDWDDALRELNRLQSLAQSTPALSGLEPEIRYFEARIKAMKGGATDPVGAAALYDGVVAQYPKSPFAARAALDAGVLLEEHGRKREALDRYRLISTRYSGDDTAAPAAAYRRALLEDDRGDWVAAKNLLEMIPLRYPESQAALDAPMAIARHYQEAGESEATQAALRRAITTYQNLLSSRPRSSFRDAYRWSQAKAQLQLGDWSGALKTIDDMVLSDPGHPLTLQGLLQGAKVAEAHGEDARAAAYLERYLAVNPTSPIAETIRAEAGRLRRTPIP